MNRLAIVMGVVFSSLLLFASTAYALGPQVNPSLNTPSGMTQAEYHALMLRSVGLNRKHALGPQVNASLNTPSGMTPAQYDALLRSVETALNTSSVSNDDGFGWNDAVIGGAVLGSILLVAGTLVAVRRTRAPIAH
jgi:hypothetical protein